MAGERPASSRVVIGVLTFRRNHDLLVTIPPLLREAATITPPATVLVIDNDPDGAAAAVMTPLADRGVRYVHEPAPGIAAARNRALREAGAGLLVFIDDDMHPEEGWLAAMVRTQQATGAAVVAGPVFADYEAAPDEWIRAGRFFARRRMPTGTPLDVAASGNMLLDLAQVTALGVEFDDRFGLLGGSDHLFTRVLAARGASMVWCDEGITFDRVPVSRMTREWVLRRAFRTGNSEVLVSLALSSSGLERAVVRLRASAGGIVRVVVGALQFLFGVTGRAVVHRARGLRMQHRGAGMVAGAFGHAYVEYARPPTSRSPVLGTR